MNKPNSPAQWFARCRSLGWSTTNSGGMITATSPRKTVITYDAKKGKFTSGSIVEGDFVRLINLLIDVYGRASHEHRKNLQNAKMDTKELFALLDICQQKEEKTPFDSWKPAGDGRLCLDYSIGPLVVSATVNEDCSWTVSMSDGGPCDRTETGKADSFMNAKLQVDEMLLEWTDEVICTGKYALKLNSRIKGVIE